MGRPQRRAPLGGYGNCGKLTSALCFSLFSNILGADECIPCIREIQSILAVLYRLDFPFASTANVWADFMSLIGKSVSFEAARGTRPSILTTVRNKHSVNVDTFFQWGLTWKQGNSLRSFTSLSYVHPKLLARLATKRRAQTSHRSISAFGYRYTTSSNTEYFMSCQLR